MADLKLVEYALYELLKNLAGGNVFAMRAKKGQQPPFIIFQRLDSERWRSINGPSGVAKPTVQIDCYDSGYYAAKNLSAQVEQLLDGFAGTVAYGSDSPQATVKITGLTLQNDLDIFDETDEPYLFRSSSKFTVTYEQ